MILSFLQSIFIILLGKYTNNVPGVTVYDLKSDIMFTSPLIQNSKA